MFHQENLDQLSKLELLDLRLNKVRKIGNLAKLSDLKSLDLYENKIQKLENLNYLRNGEIINVHSAFLTETERIDK